MKYQAEYRDPIAAQRLQQAIQRITTRHWTIMEVCGGQTHTIVKYGIDELLPPEVELVHGPGCPVCVTPLELIDKAIEIASRPNVIFCSFGDMLRVPGSRGDLFSVKAAGGDVRIVYSPLDCLKIAESNPQRTVVFFAVGFETTSPPNAMAVWQAKQRGIENFAVLVSHVLVPPAMTAILSSPANRVQGFLAAGHVCTVVGYEEYEPLAEQFQIPIVVTGFEPVDLLEGVYHCVEMLEAGKWGVQNQYARVVRREGNSPRAASSMKSSRLPTASGAAWALSPTAACGYDPSSHASTPKSGSKSKAWKSTNRASASADSYCKASRSRTSVRPSEKRARPNARLARRWFPLKEPAQPITTTAIFAAGNRPTMRFNRSDEDTRMTAPVTLENLTCPVPLTEYDRVLLGHGSGGKLTAELIQRLFLPELGNEILAAMEDQATVSLADPSADGATLPQLAFTTDSFVVRPLFFPGGDIGKLAVHGTVNDLAVGGATPLFLSAAFILEEGLPMDDLRRVVSSMHAACDEAGVQLVTGDTKVVDRTTGDQLFITTSGIGRVPAGRRLSIHNAGPGDKILVSGTIGDHGIAIMSVREGIEFETVLESDTAPLNDLTRIMLDTCPVIRCMRDPTRGGVSSALNELAAASNVGVKLQESAIPIRPEVHAACEMLGLDPLYVANEGKLLAIVPAADAYRLLAAMREHPLGRNAAIIGDVVSDHPGMVVMRSLIGGERVVSMLAGEQLPRIC